jgi:hypothetical protein
MRDLVTNTIVPKLCQLRDELNAWLVPRYGEDLYIDFDITSLPEMQQDMERMTRSLRDANWLTFDEKRVAMNYSEKEGPYEYSYVNGGLVRLDQVGMDLTVPGMVMPEPIEDEDNSMDNGRDDMVNGDDSSSQDGVGEEMPN